MGLPYMHTLYIYAHLSICTICTVLVLGRDTACCLGVSVSLQTKIAKLLCYLLNNEEKIFFNELLFAMT